MRLQLNTTLTEDQLDFIRNNVNNMTQKQMAIKLGCSQGKAFENARVAGIVFPKRSSNQYKKFIKIVDSLSEAFDSSFSTCPITGFLNY